MRFKFARNLPGAQLMNTKVRFEQVFQLRLRREVKRRPDACLPILASASEFQVLFTETNREISATGAKRAVDVTHIFFAVLRKNVVEHFPIIGKVEGAFDSFKTDQIGNLDEGRITSSTGSCIHTGTQPAAIGDGTY